MNIKTLKMLVKRYLHPQMNCRAMLWEPESEMCIGCGRCPLFWQFTGTGVGSWFFTSKSHLRFIDKRARRIRWLNWVKENLNPCDGPSDNCPNLDLDGPGTCHFRREGKCQQYKVYQMLVNYLEGN